MIFNFIAGCFIGGTVVTTIMAALQVSKDADRDFEAMSDRWIPIEKRPPEINDIVLVCYDHETQDDGLIEIVQFLGETDGFGWDHDQRIMAWQPLPGAYKA